MFHREKGFYVSLACAALAVVALGAVCYKVASPEEDKQSVASEESKAPAPTATIWARETVKQPTAIVYASMCRISTSRQHIVM